MSCYKISMRHICHVMKASKGSNSGPNVLHRYCVKCTYNTSTVLSFLIQATKN